MALFREKLCVCVRVCEFESAHRFSVQIFLVHYVDSLADSMSSNLSDLEEDYYLLLYALFPPASNEAIPYYDTSVCERGERERTN